MINIFIHEPNIEDNSGRRLRHSQNKDGRFITFMDPYDINTDTEDIEN